MTADSDKPDVDPRQVEAFEPLPGDLLVAARRSRGMSTAKAAAALNLDETVVLALDENRFEDLGAPVFARGHLRKYARLLELNPDDVIRAYDAVATEQSGAALTVSAAVAQPAPRDSGPWRLRVMIVVALAVTAVVVWRILNSIEGPAVTPTIQAPALSPTVGVTPEPGEESPPASTIAGPDQADMAAESETPALAQAAPDQGRPGDESSPGPAASEPPVADASAGTVPADGVEPAGTSAPAEAGVLIFTFQQDSWLEVRDADGRRLAYELGRRGVRRTITGHSPFQVSLGYWPGVSVSYEGQEVTVPESARQGNTARFSVPSSADN